MAATKKGCPFGFTWCDTNCALWGEYWRQCSVKSIADALFNLNPKREVT